MKNPSTADRPESPQPRDRPVDDAKVTERSATHAAVEGETSPRLPHERDESSDAGAGAPRKVMRQAADDLDSGKVQTDRGEVTDQLYARTLRGSAGDAPGEQEPKKR